MCLGFIKYVECFAGATINEEVVLIKQPFTNGQISQLATCNFPLKTKLHLQAIVSQPDKIRQLGFHFTVEAEQMADMR